jgi:hypothetical protein
MISPFPWDKINEAEEVVQMHLKRAFSSVLLVLAVAALSAPSMASAKWLHDHDPITSNQTINFSGKAGFIVSGGSGTACAVSGTIEATSSSTTGHLNHFSIGTHDECESTGLFVGCTIESATVTNSKTKKHITDSPLPLHINDHHLVLTDLTIDTVYEHPDAQDNCRLPIGGGMSVPITGNSLHFDEVTVIPDDAKTIDHLGASGDGEITINTTGAGTIPAAVAVDEAKTTIELEDPDTWGIDGTDEE